MNFYTCPRLTFLKKNATENAYKRISEPLDFKIFRGRHAPRPPLTARALGAPNLPRLVLKSGYGPVVQIFVAAPVMVSNRLCQLETSLARFVNAIYQWFRKSVKLDENLLASFLRRRTWATVSALKSQSSGLHVRFDWQHWARRIKVRVLKCCIKNAHYKRAFWFISSLI